MKKKQQQQEFNKYKGKDKDFGGKTISIRGTMAKDFNDLKECKPALAAKRRYNYVGLSIKMMEAKADDYKEFKKKSINDIDMSKFSMEIEIKKGKDWNRDAIMVT